MLKVCGRRWYDQDIRVAKFLRLIEQVPEKAQEELSQMIIEFVNLIRKTNEENKDNNFVSLGKERVLGLYQAANKRRWYDKKPELKSAMNTLSTLQIEDYLRIVQGITETIEAVLQEQQREELQAN